MQEKANSPRQPAASPYLDVRGPVWLALGVLALFLGGGVGGAALLTIDRGVSLSGSIIVETKVKAVQHQRGGIIGELHVREGQDVTAGQVLVTLDTQALDEQIAALRAQAHAAHRQLDLARQEAATMSDLLERKLAARSRVLALERQVAELDKEVAGLQARIAIAEQELGRSEIRAPVAGRILSLAVHGPGSVIQPGVSMAEIVPREDRLVVEGRLPPAHIEDVRAGMDARVWFGGTSWRERRPLAARLAWVSPDSIEDKRTGASYFVARLELENARSEAAERFAPHPGMRTEILLLTGQRTLLDQVLDPLVRNMNRAFRT